MCTQCIVHTHDAVGMYTHCRLSIRLHFLTESYRLARDSRTQSGTMLRPSFSVGSPCPCASFIIKRPVIIATAT